MEMILSCFFTLSPFRYDSLAISFLVGASSFSFPYMNTEQRQGERASCNWDFPQKRESERDVPRTFHTFEKNVRNRREEKGIHNSEQGDEEKTGGRPSSFSLSKTKQENVKM